MYQIKQSTTAYPLKFLLVSSTDHVTGVTGLTPTVKIGKVGGTGISPTGAITEIDATNLPGWYQVAGNATDSNTLGPLILHATGTGADPGDMMYEVVAFDPQDAVRQGLTALPNVASGSAGALLVSGTGTAALSVTSGGLNLINANVVNASALATDAVTEIQSGLATATALGDGTVQAGTLGTTAAATVKTQIVNALTTDTYAELSSVPAATSTLKDKLTYLFMNARNKSTQTATTRLLRNDGDSGTVGTSTVSDDGTTFIKGKDA